LRVALASSGLVPVPPVKGGAVEEYVYQLSRHLRMLGVDAVAIDANHDGDKVVYEDVNGAQILRVPTPKPRISFKERIIQELLFGRSVIKYMDKEGFDIGHANTAWAGFTLAMHRSIRRPRTQRFVYTCHNGLWTVDNVHTGEKVVRIAEGYAMNSANIVIALNKTMYTALAKKAKVNSGKMTIVPNGVDIDFFRPGLKDELVLSKYGLKEQNYILFVGRVCLEKGVHALLRAFKHISNELPKSFRLVIVGPLTGAYNTAQQSSYAEAIVKYAREKLSERVIFTGENDKSSLRILYSNAYCLVLPSLAEAFPMVLLEAMASGTPPIGSIAGGIPDIITDGVNGLLFRKGDWKDLANKLQILIQDKSFRDKLAHNARKYTEKNFSWNIVAEKIREIYNSIV
jgi:glycosyltransferase involved in cell wall biosynthesis